MRRQKVSQKIRPNRFDTTTYGWEAARIMDFGQILKINNSTGYGPTLAVVMSTYSVVPKGVRMTVVCSWCRQEGQAGVIREKAPFEDRRETHGICMAHRIQVRASWNNVPRSAPSDGTSTAQDRSGDVVRSASHLLSSLRNLSRKAGL